MFRSQKTADSPLLDALPPHRLASTLVRAACTPAFVAPAVSQTVSIGSTPVPTPEESAQRPEQQSLFRMSVLMHFPPPLAVQGSSPKAPPTKEWACNCQLTQVARNTELKATYGQRRPDLHTPFLHNNHHAKLLLIGSYVSFMS